MRGSGRRAVALVVLASVTSACSIQTDSAPRDIPDDQRGRLGGETPSPDESTGEGRIYLLGPGTSGRPLQSAPRDSGGRLEGLVDALVEGPNATEIREGLRSAIPSDVDVLSVELNDGVVDVDLSNEILDTPPDDLQLAVAQIVLTATELRGDRSVLIRADGQLESWPNGAGRDQSAPLSIYDFIDYPQSSQPAFPVPPAQPAVAPASNTTTTLSSVVADDDVSV